MVNYAALNLDRWIAAQSQTVEDFALYSFIGTILIMGQSVQAVVNTSIYPLMTRCYARTNLINVFQLCLKISCCSLMFSMLLAIPSWWLLNEGIQHWFPKYNDGLELLSFMIFVAAVRISDFWTSFMIITGLENRLLFINIVAVVSSICLWVYWMQPWYYKNIELIDIVLLAILLSSVNYILTALESWRSIRRKI